MDNVWTRLALGSVAGILAWKAMGPEKQQGWLKVLEQMAEASQHRPEIMQWSSIPAQQRLRRTH